MILCLGIVIGLAHFLRANQFGLYEDDWYRVPKTLGITGHDLWNLIRESSRPGPSQGRPFHPAFIYAFSFLGFKMGGLTAVYAIAFAILLANATLFYFLLQRVFRDRQFAFLGALAFCLFPADTTQPFLTHGLGVQPAIALLLIAFHCYLSDWKVFSYAAIFLMLFTYETPYPVFLAAPLLQRRSKAEIIRHTAIIAGLFACVILVRTMTAEARLTHINSRDLFLGSLNIVTGPITCLAMYAYRPVDTILHMTRQELLFLPFCCLALYGILTALLSSKGRSLPFPAANATAFPNGESSLGPPSPPLIGFVMLIAAYPLTLTTTGIAIAGRGTRAHTAAILGASILCAWMCSVFLARPSGKSGKRWSTFGVASFFTLLLGFGLQVQGDYVRGWREEQAFWTDLVKLCPDMSDGDAIYVEPTELRDTRQLAFLRKDSTGVPDSRQIKSLDVLYDVLPEIYDFPSEWKNPPRVYRLPRNWEAEIFGSNDRLRILTIESGYSYFPSVDPTVSSKNVIFLDTKDGKLTRNRKSLFNPNDGHQLPLKQDTQPSPALVRTRIYPYVILKPDETKSTYLVK